MNFPVNYKEQRTVFWIRLCLENYAAYEHVTYSVYLAPPEVNNEILTLASRRSPGANS
jgi:hypothetical protein